MTFVTSTDQPKCKDSVVAHKNRTTEAPKHILFEGEFTACNFNSKLRYVKIRVATKSSLYALSSVVHTANIAIRPCIKQSLKRGSN